MINLSQFFATQRTVSADFETVVLRRIVTGCHHHPSISGVKVRREVVDGCGYYPHVDHVQPSLHQSGDEGTTDARRTVAHILAHHQGLAISLSEEGAYRLPNPYHYLIWQILVGDAPDAEFSKDVSIQIRFSGDLSPLVNVFRSLPGGPLQKMIATVSIGKIVAC